MNGGAIALTARIIVVNWKVTSSRKSGTGRECDPPAEARHGPTVRITRTDHESTRKFPIMPNGKA